MGGGGYTSGLYKVYSRYILNDVLSESSGQRGREVGR